MTGDCFPAAVAAAEVIWARGAEAYIAHGMPIGRGPENNGVRYWHAWVEAKVPGRGWYVVDASNGATLGAKRALYYKVGRIEPAQVHRFTEDEARAQMASRDHFGPWVDDYEDATP